MEILPAIDLLGDEAVRLHQGDYERVTGFGAPLALAARFAAETHDALALLQTEISERRGIAESIAADLGYLDDSPISNESQKGN